MDFMKTVLIIGGGGREHALLKALLRSDTPLCTYAHPGNPGMAADGCTNIDKKFDGWEGLAQWALENQIDLAIVGPEVPLVEGIVDVFWEKGISIFGPTKAAARIEGSKEFAKKLMRKYGIPTAAFEVFTDKNSALAYLRKVGVPIVVKASGLASGKGAVVCNTFDEASRALASMFDDRAFGDAASTVVLEEKMTGEEASVFVLTDGNNYRVLPVAQDHKRIGDGDKGPNTGGMGAYAPAPIVDPAMMERIERQIVVPTLEAMRKEGAPYRGLLYVGIMATPQGPKVVEFNCRFGDPETQAVLPIVKCNWYQVLKACADGRLASVKWEVTPRACAAVVLASHGYPGYFERGKVITGIAQAEAGKPQVDVYHAGTALDAEGRLTTNGGRVLTVSAWADSLEEAIRFAYEAADKIRFEGKILRRDIGAKGLARLAPIAGKTNPPRSSKAQLSGDGKSEEQKKSRAAVGRTEGKKKVSPPSSRHLGGAGGQRSEAGKRRTGTHKSASKTKVGKKIKTKIKIKTKTGTGAVRKGAGKIKSKTKSKIKSKIKSKK